MTLGEYLVGIGFNPAGDPKVASIKQKAAALIDEIDSIPDGGNPEVARLKALGRTDAEAAGLWGVKAATKPDPPGELQGRFRPR